MFPLCFVHGVHGIRSDQDNGARVTDESVGRAAPRRRLFIACLTIVFIAMVALTGCESSDRTESAAPPRTPIFSTDDIAGPDFDAMFVDEFP